MQIDMSMIDGITIAITLRRLAALTVSSPLDFFGTLCRHWSILPCDLGLLQRAERLSLVFGRFPTRHDVAAVDSCGR